jgi:hypothetical protein
MKHVPNPFFHKYFNDDLDFRAQIFNTLGFLGCALGLFFGFFSIVNYTGALNVMCNFGAAVAAFVIIRQANRTGAFKAFFLVTVILVFFGIFPVLFFLGGGYKGSMPCFFVFALVFTVIMLTGRRRTLLTLMEYALYLGCFLLAYFYPNTVVNFDSERELATVIIVGCLL